MVQVLLSPRAIVPEQPADALAAYPAAGASVTEYAPTEVSVFVTPGDSAPANELPPTATTPLIVSVKSAATFVPPLSLTTCLITARVAVCGAGCVPQRPNVSPWRTCALTAGKPTRIVWPLWQRVTLTRPFPRPGLVSGLPGLPPAAAPTARTRNA